MVALAQFALIPGLVSAVALRARPEVRDPRAHEGQEITHMDAQGIFVKARERPNFCQFTYGQDYRFMKFIFTAVNVPHVTSRLDYARYHRPLPTPGIGGRSDNGCGSSIHDLCLEQGAGGDDSANIKSKIKVFLSLLLSEQRLQHAEMFLKGAYSITDDTVRYRQRLAQVKQKSNELIGEYIGRLRECLAEGRCLGINISNDELLDKFVRGLRQNYQKAVKTIYAHIRDTNELCSVLTLWEASNGENATVNSLSVDDDSVNAEAPQVLQAAQAQGKLPEREGSL
ncbi:hypothetical protein FOZ60_000764 [Perkinsus olseni]|uniref:Uncharacterized protein n=1 Tax=Perkinsus olseni TaxID=32597 RepID=A0A7J6P3W9_PEROL|nr:hypothetical protein FOZ60_000764 [Perkinsus olseni]